MRCTKCGALTVREAFWKGGEKAFRYRCMVCGTVFVVSAERENEPERHGLVEFKLARKVDRWVRSLVKSGDIVLVSEKDGLYVLIIP